ncbi:MAG: hypothetical protein AAFQ82_12325, partial [Myxococcota bacterium]
MTSAPISRLSPSTLFSDGEFDGIHEPNVNVLVKRQALSSARAEAYQRTAQATFDSRVRVSMERVNAGVDAVVAPVTNIA